MRTRTVTKCYIKLVHIAGRDLLPNPLHLVLDTGTCRYVIAHWTVGVASSIHASAVRYSGHSFLQVTGLDAPSMFPLSGWTWHTLCVSSSAVA